MPRYRLAIKSSAEKEMGRLADDLHQKISDKILKLAENPRPSGCVKLQGTDGYRLRFRQYRILYTIDDGPSYLVTVYSVAHRREAYR